MDSNSAAQTATNASIVSGATTAGITVTEQYVGWVTSNAIVIGVSCTAISMVIALIFHIINARINRNRNRLQLAIQIDKWESEGKSPEDIQRLIKMAGMK